MITWRVYKRVVMAAVVVVIGLGMVSCVDKADNSVTPSDKEQQAQDAKQEKAQKFWAVVSQLVDVDDYTDDYESKTFEPTYGVSQGDEGTRYVYTNTAAAAAARFADLVEQEGIDENTETYTYDDPDVGKLVYTKGSGRILATVDVSIKQIPSLKKIVYVPGAYANGSFQGRAYYRFGDVVKRPVTGYPNGDVTEYWICVRPSFGPESKGDSHWVCLNVLPKKNVWFYHSDTNSKDYYLPTGLGTNQEHMQNLAEMLYAIYDPTEWQENVSNIAKTDLVMFHDFDKTKYTLHNQYFWKNVQRQWKNKDILKKAFNYTGSEEEFKRMLFGNENEEGDGLHLLYYGYSWYKSISWNATLYEAIYKNGAANKEKNMHLASTKEQTRHMKEIDIDCRKMGKDNFFDYNTFFNDGGIYRWTVRHATGKELASDGRYDVRTAIRGVTEVYRYYHDVEPTAADAYATTDPEETPKPKTINKDDVKVGHIIAQSGSFYANCEDARDSQDEPVAMVVYLGSKNRVEKDQPWNGLAIALKDLRMGDGKYPRYVSFCEDASQKREKCNSGTSDNKALASFCNGWAVTQKLKDHCNAGHKHPVAEAVWNMDKVDGCSEWFIPAAGQWDLAMLGQGFGRYSAGGNWGLWGYHNEQGKWLFKQAGAEDCDIELEGYITCTETENGYKLWYFQGHLNMDGFDFFTRDKTEFFFLRPFIAFEYGNGGSVNPEEPWAPLPVQEVQAKSWLGEDGNFYKTVDHVRTATAKDPVAYVVYVGEEGSIEVDNKKYRGLAISVKEEDADIIGLTWNQLNDKAKQYTTNLTEKVRQEKGFSPWFAASKDYWQKAFEQGFGLQFEIIDGQLVSKERFTAVAWTYLNVANYWTATEDGDKAYYFSLSRDPNDNSLRDKVRFLLLDKTATAVNKEADKMAFRPMIAFR